MTAPTLAYRGADEPVLVIHPERREAFAREISTSGFGKTFPGEALETRGDGLDVIRIRDLLESRGTRVVIAAGGDGTVSTVARGLLEIPDYRRPNLAILPLGTANNVARSFGLLSVRVDGATAARRTLASIDSEHSRRIDVGEANGIPFVGSFALGMDAAILRLRNRLRDQLRLNGALGGYPLYLASTALQGIAHAKVKARTELDGVHSEGPIYNLLVTSCPVYAGEFRFGGPGGVPPGALGVHAFRGRAQYLKAYVAAWRRHVNHNRGLRTYEPETTQRCRELRVRLPAPATAQIDGEEIPATDDWQIRFRPSALRLLLPPTA
ncbi:MAG: diacylglycerol kinase family protein [Candidatus Binatia bacterium]|nr:diacylglycerol kinase family protein [Candidatus Binatia bacterium]